MAGETIESVFRDFQTAGVPSSGAHEPVKSEIRNLLNALVFGAFPDNRVIELNNAGAGTGDALEVTTAEPIPDAAYKAIYILQITDANTGPVTVSINGASPVPVVDNTGQPLDAGVLQAGMGLLAVDDGSSLRLFVYGDIESRLANVLNASRNLEELSDKEDARYNLGLGEVLLSISDLRQRSRARDGLAGYPWALYDLAGSIAAGVTPEGGFVVPKLQIPRNPDSREGYPYVDTLNDEEGNVALGVLPDGSIDIPRPYGISPEDFSAGHQVFNVRRHDGAWYANYSDPYVYDVRLNAPGGSALAVHPEPMIFLPVTGQSNAGPVGASAPLITDALYPFTSVSFNGREVASGDVAVGTLPAEVAPVDDAGRGNQVPATMTAFAIEDLTRDIDRRPTPGVFAWTAYYGGQPISSFERGTTVWDNVMAGAAASVTTAAAFNRTIECPAVVFIQGEQESPDYQASLTALAADMTGEIQLQMGLAAPPKMIITQINVGDTAVSARQVPLAQLAAAVAGDVVLAGPMYHLPIVDAIHQSPIGRMMLGEMIALSHRAVVRDGSFTPLWPTSATLTDDHIDIVFAVPGEGLALDNDWVKPVSNYGFTYVDDSSSAAIASVDIISADTVRVTLDAVPLGANPRIQYALEGDTLDDGWPGGRGQLYSPSGFQSPYHRRGFSVPSHIRHYAIRFEETL